MIDLFLLICFWITAATASAAMLAAAVRMVSQSRRKAARLARIEARLNYWSP